MLTLKTKLMLWWWTGFLWAVSSDVSSSEPVHIKKLTQTHRREEYWIDSS